MWKQTNQLQLVSNDVILSDELEPIGLHHREFHGKT